MGNLANVTESILPGNANCLQMSALKALRSDRGDDKLMLTFESCVSWRWIFVLCLQVRDMKGFFFVLRI